MSGDLPPSASWLDETRDDPWLDEGYEKEGYAPVYEDQDPDMGQDGLDDVLLAQVLRRLLRIDLVWSPIGPGPFVLEASAEISAAEAEAIGRADPRRKLA